MRVPVVYRVLLHCYPAAFRQEYGSQMVLMFQEQLDEARRAGDRLAQAALWVRAGLDALTIAPKEHGHVMVQDLRYAVRTLIARPGFAMVAILSLALGIGANTAIFSLWNGILHAALPMVRKPGELAMLTNPAKAGAWHGNVSGERDYMSYKEFEDLRDHAGSFSAMMASESSLNRWQLRFAGSEPEEVQGRLVSGGYFQTLGVGPAMGQLFRAEDDGKETPYAVLSYGFWQRRFGGRADVLGKSFTLRQAVLTIVGIAPRGFIGETVGQQPDLWIPLCMQPRVLSGGDALHEAPPEKAMWLHVFGRLKPGISLGRAEGEANGIFKTNLESFYASASAERRREYLDQRLKIRPGASGASLTRHDFSTSLTALLAAVFLLLWIACANLANLMLARGAARKSEMALRLSLGASRGRLIRQLATESLLLAALGAIAGLGVAYFLRGGLERMIAQSDRDFRMAFSLDPTVLVFTLAVTLAAGLLFGLLPAWQVTRGHAGATLREQGRRGSPGRMGWGRFLVSLQLALSLPLLLGAGLLARTVFNLQRADVGFSAERLLLVRVNLREAGYENTRRNDAMRDLRGQLQQIPGVRAVSYSELGLFSGGESLRSIEVEGYAARNDDDRGSATDAVGPGYFSTLGIGMAAGREIQGSDFAGTARVAVINEAFANRFFDRRNPIGMRITSVDDDKRTTYEVVGVARNAHTKDLRGVIEPRYFVPAMEPPGPTLLIRTAGGNAPAMAAVRRTIRRMDAALPVLSAESIEDQMAPLTAQDRTIAQVAAAFGGLALLLAAIGLYGTLSYGVARRTGEIAVRIALGARPGRVIAMILRETAWLLMAGLVVGAALAYGASRLIASRLYGVAAGDPIAIGLATGLLLLVALGAAYLPARKASRLDPMAALRQE